MLVIVDQLSGLEAFPTRKANTEGVIKALLKEIMPRHGVPVSIQSDRGLHFTAEKIDKLHAFMDRKKIAYCLSPSSIWASRKNEQNY